MTGMNFIFVNRNNFFALLVCLKTKAKRNSNINYNNINNKIERKDHFKYLNSFNLISANQKSAHTYTEYTQYDKKNILVYKL